MKSFVGFAHKMGRGVARGDHLSCTQDFSGVRIPGVPVAQYLITFTLVSDGLRLIMR